MQGVKPSTMEPQAFSLGDSLFAVEIDLSLYSRQVILRACYRLTGRCYVFMAHTKEPGWLTVAFLSKNPETAPRDLAGELYNELLDQQIREALEIEMGPVREMIVAQAFAEGNLLDPLRDEGNYEEDPLGIGGRR